MDVLREEPPMTIGKMAVDMLVSALRSSTPMAFVLCGEIMGQRAGIVNIGVEGEMLVGAATAFAVTSLTGSPWLGLLAGATAGMALSTVHGVLCLYCHTNQVASGVAVLAIGAGCSAYYGTPYVGRQIAGFSPFAIRGLPAGMAEVLRSVSPTMFLSLLVPPLLAIFLYMTRTGLRWRAVGEAPASARILGLNPTAYRWAAVLACGFLAGFGGAALSVDYAKGWSEGMTAGRGLVALGLVVMTRWNPLWTTPVAMIFGAAETLSLSIQSHGVAVSPYLLSLFPYLTPLVILAVHAKFSRKQGRMPASLADILKFSA
jgi:general nucleoside transport system permease protein